MEQAVTEGARERAEILGVGVDSISADGLRAEILRMVRGGEHALVLHVNVHGLNLAYRRPWLHRLFNSASVVFCDGYGVVLAAKILGHTGLQRFTYADEMWRLAEFAEAKGLSLFFLGARPGVAEKAAARLKEKTPSLRIVGVHHGYFDRTAGSPENEAVLREINVAKPDILVVGFGMPLQELWLKENWKRLDAGVAITLGAIFDYVSGELRRGPRFLTDNGFEWLARLLIEPRRLWRRYVVGNPIFLARVLKQRLIRNSGCAGRRRLVP
ncbi:MAG: WecB/TagA/CpsF family glycosyltransferase [Actinobacteria bacterium]|nr:WecB/TagA/CpsF family glycosyltransferase [Actinomycetota bacterium]